LHGWCISRAAVLIQAVKVGPLPPDLSDQVARALAEDIGAGDVTAALIPAATAARATLVTREDMVLCGSAWLTETFRQVDAATAVTWHATEANRVTGDSVLCTIEGPARAILTAERAALNFLQTLSGTATQTRRYVELLEGTNCRILDTRKTIPGLRLAQKYAVSCGGGQNHRMGLHDMVLIKENHIIAAGSIAAAVAQARRQNPNIAVEVEVESLAELQAALAVAPDVIMLDEFELGDMRKAVAARHTAGVTTKLEASGGVELSTLRAIAETGIDFISVGALTKHLRAIDLSLRFQTLS
jgi:nicotinate-nucleotide pyrophosphorylase (carboxylating)